MNLVWPVTGRVSQEYHQDGVHPGIDIMVPTGTPVDASGDGLVVATQTPAQSGGYGNFVLVDHGDGIVTAYAHLSSIAVHPGQTVRAGEVIGLSGSTGYSTGPHLHEEVRDHGRTVNPRDYFGPGQPSAGGGTGTVPATSGAPGNTAPGGPGSSGATSITGGATASRLGLIVLGAAVVVVAVLVMFKDRGDSSHDRNGEAQPAGRDGAK